MTRKNLLMLAITLIAIAPLVAGCHGQELRDIERAERMHDDLMLRNSIDSATNGLLSNQSKSCNPAPAAQGQPGINFVPGPGWQFPQDSNPTKAGDTTSKSDSNATNTVNVYVDRNLVESYGPHSPRLNPNRPPPNPHRPPMAPPRRETDCSDDDEFAQKLQRLDDLIQAHEELFLRAEAMVAYWDEQISQAKKAGNPSYGAEQQKALVQAKANAHKRGIEETKAEKAKYCSY